MTTILHGSDLHFGRPHDAGVREALRRTIRELSPELLVFSGDFTQRAKVREYREARAFLDRLPDVPVITTPGNHDIPLYRVWERLFAPLRNYRRWISDPPDSVVELPGLSVVALDSTAPHRAIVNGRLDAGQLSFAADALRRSPAGSTRILVLHHNLRRAPDRFKDPPLPGAESLLDWVEQQGIALVLAGHLHRNFIERSRRILAREENSEGTVILHSGTTTSTRGRTYETGQNSFNLIRLHADRMKVCKFKYLVENEGFVPVTETEFARTPDRVFPGAAESREVLRTGGRETS